MLGRITYTWQAIACSWRILKSDRKLILYSALSGICCLAVIISFALPLILTTPSDTRWETLTPAQETMFYAILFLFYFSNYSVITFFNSAIVANSIARMRGEHPTFGNGLSKAIQLLPQILGWALLSATIGVILRLIEERSERLGRLVTSFLGLTWTLTAYLVIPVIVVEKRGPFSAYRKSASLLKRTWGKQIFGNFTFGLIFFLLALLAVPVLYALRQAGETAFLAAVGIAIVYWVCLALIKSTLEAVFQSALYAYAEMNTVPEGFTGNLLDDAIGRH